MPPVLRIRARGAVFAAAAFCVPALADAQSLRGSRGSINRMYRQARAERLHFYETGTGVRNAVRKERLVRLSPDGNFRLHRVTYPYVQPQTRTFVRRFAAQYREACGEQLVITSAVRPARRQPWNSSRRSVHPTGMAVDLRKPDGKCLRWLRNTLLELEGAGLLEATEERGPPHFHVAVFPTPYRRYVARRERGVMLASGATRYRVRPGDTLSEIAREHDTTVDRLVEANRLEDDVIVPGQRLLIPSG